MSTFSPAAKTTATSAASPRILEAGIAVFAVVYLSQALIMVVSPHSFYKSIGGFDSYNPHYLRDVATFAAALGVGLAVSLGRPAWRVPMLAVATVQYGLHTINHLVDIDIAHPQWTGYFDFFSLAASTLALAWLLRTAIARERAPASERDRKEISR